VLALCCTAKGSTNTKDELGSLAFEKSSDALGELLYSGEMVTQDDEAREV
jgi:hypothetical protein